MDVIRRHASYANVMATIAVFLALGGAGMAAKSLKKNSVGPKQLKANAVSEPKIADGAVTQPKIASGSVVKGKLGDLAVGNGKIEDNAVTASKISDGQVGLAKAANSLHQNCRGGTVYITGACVDQANSGGATGDDYIAVEQDCQTRQGRLASAPELALLVRGGFGTIPTPLYSWAMELTSTNTQATIITNTGSIGSDAVANLHGWRCAFPPNA